MTLSDSISALFQRMIPQKAITWIFKKAANSSFKPLKNWMISRFILKYNVNMSEAMIQNIQLFENFNAFFIRQLKSELRPITRNEKTIASPVDGCVRQMGLVQQGKIFNAKGHAFSLYELLGGDLERCTPFLQGTYANLYLAPSDYHRVHMPYAGKLKTMIYIPGKLFSVKESSVNVLPNLFSQNERIVLVFETAIGPMVMVLVGAMIVGNMHVVWEGDIVRSKNIRQWDYSNDAIEFAAGDEIGHFKLGSTVFVLFTNQNHTVTWEKELGHLQYGQVIGHVKNTH